jgi:outer membrane protein assembly factor BamB
MYSHDFNIKKWPLYSSPDSIEIISGNNQSANTGQTLPNDIVVEAVDSKDSPISNVPVYFKTAGNCGSVDNSKVVTGSKGKASVSWKLGSKTGKQTLYAYLKKADGNIIRHSKININATADGNTNSNMVKWKFNAESSISTSPAIGHNGTIYAGADNGYLYAVNETGSQIWKFKTDNSIHSSPTVDKNGNIYVGSDDGFLYAINSDGSLRWRYEVGNKIRSSPGIGYNGTIYFGANDGYLYALTSDGKLKWKFETEHKFDENLERVEWKVESSPAIGMDGTIYIGSIYVGHDYWLGLMYYSYLYAINPDGSQKWRYKTESNINNAPSIGPNGKVYVSGGPLYAINSDGTLRWKYSSKYNFNSSLSIDSYGRIYGGSGEFIIEDSYFHLYAIHPDGSRKWKFELTENIATTPVLGADGTLYFGGDDKYIYAVNADGTQKWRHKTGGKIQSSPVMDTKGTIYFGSDDGYLYAIQVGTRQAETPWPMFQNDPQNSGRKNR